MDKICKAYVSQVKTILPVRGKKEKAFVRKLHNDLCDYCEYNNINHIEELYKKYGTPQEVVFEYISLMEPDIISKRINTAKYIRILIASLITISFLATAIWSIYIYHLYDIAQRQEIVAIEDSIQYNNFH